MKKLIVFITTFCIVLASYAQADSTLVWKADAKKIKDSIYQITVNTIVPQSWYLYGNNKQIEGLDNVQFVFGNNTIQPIGELSFLLPRSAIVPEGICGVSFSSTLGAVASFRDTDCCASNWGAAAVGFDSG